MRFLPPFMMVLALFLAAPLSPARAGDDVVQFATDDPEMRAAMTAARQSLPAFLSRVLSANTKAPSHVTLKVALQTTKRAQRETGVTTEVIWVDSIRRKGDRFTARLANAPNMLGKLRLGDTVSFSQEQIRDWGMTGADGRLVGHYTTRVVAGRLDPAQAAQIRGLLSPSPLPDAWE